MAERDIAAGVAEVKRRRPGRRDDASLADDSLADDSLALSPTTDSLADDLSARRGPALGGQDLRKSLDFSQTAV